MWTAHHCRHCGQAHQKGKPIGIKKYRKDRLLALVREYVLKRTEAYRASGEYRDSRVFKEEIARELKTHTGEVEHCLHILNLEGLVRQPVHKAPHDSTRDRWGGGGDSAWGGDLYFLNA